MFRKIRIIIGLTIGILYPTLLSGCGLLLSNDLIANRYADALLTKNNELQFRFRINDNLLEGTKVYKVKITIHDEKLAAAIGKREIIYGEDQVRKGKYLDVKSKEKYIFMDPIPLKEDLHINELNNMIVNHKAISIEVFNDKEVFGREFLTNFSSEL